MRSKRRRTTRRPQTLPRRCLAESLEVRVPLSATPTAISVAVSSAQAVYGQAITLTATVSAAPTAPSEGTVSFLDGGNLLGTASVNAGAATLSGVRLDAGNHSITASFSDSLGNYAASCTTPQANSLITTVAGDGVQGSSGINGPAISAQLHWPKGVVVDSAGDLFIADTNNNRVLEVNHATGIVTTIAGNGTYGYSGDGGLATAAEIRFPGALALDASGDLFIADTSNDCVREVNLTTGIITTVAGTGTFGYSGDGGPATSAKLLEPAGIAFDSSGDLFIVDQGNNRIREVNATTGTITTVAGDGTAGYTGDGGAPTSAELNQPQGIAIDSAGDLFVADRYNFVVREIHAGTGIITTVAGDGIVGRNGDGGTATSAELDYPAAVAVAPGGALYIADSYGERVREVDPITGIITTIAGNQSSIFGGDRGPAESAQLDDPEGLSFDSAGDLFIADTQNDRIRMIFNGTPVTITPASTALSVAVSSPQAVYGQAITLSATVYASPTAPPEGMVTFMDGANLLGTAPVSSGAATLTNVLLNAANHQITASYTDSLGNYASSVSTPSNSLINTVAGSGVQGYSGDNGPATSADLNNPTGIAVDAAGDLFIVDAHNNRIREVNHASGIITTVAGNGIRGYSGDGGAATSAELNNPYGIVVDAAGNLFIADAGNSRIREVNHATGIITTVAGNGTSGYSGDGGVAASAEIWAPAGLTVDSSGDLFIADGGNERIREVNHATGVITTVAGNGTYGFSGDGGAATSAEFAAPDWIAVDSAGNLFVGDGNNNRIREVHQSTGVVTSIAGNGTYSFSGDGGPAISAKIENPVGISLDSSGNIFFIDNLTRVREIVHATGVITTVAGNGSIGFGGDGGPADSAKLYCLATAVDSSGNLFIDDSGNGCIREVFNGGFVTITPAALAITADNQTKVYGAALPTWTASYSGFVNGDSAASLTTQPTLSTTATAASSVAGGAYAITASGAVDTNYSITYVSGSLTVTPASLTIIADDQTKVYGAAVPTLTANYVGLVNGESAASLTTQPTLSTTATAASFVAGGPYAINVSGAVDANYTITYVSGSLMVTPAPLMITADNKTKVFGKYLPMLTASYSGFVSGDSAASLTTQPILSTTATATSPVGPYVITVGGAVEPNYTIAYANGTLTVVPLPVAADDAYVIGSGTVTIAAANGVLANDSPSGGLTVIAASTSGASGGTFTFNSDGSFTYSPPAHFVGYDYARYTVGDGLGDTSAAAVTVLSHEGGVAWKFYESVLGRRPDDVGLNAWINHLSQGGSTGDMAVAFAESDELLDQVIGGYYQQYLGRTADAAGLNGWKSVWRAAGGPEIVQAYIAASGEFLENAGGTTDGWLTAIYQRVLDRAPDAQGLSYWRQQLAAGTTEVGLVLAFLESPEAYRDDVATWFRQDFEATPSPAQLNFYVAQMLAGSSDAAIEQQLAGSPAYASTAPAAAPGAAVRLPDYLSWRGS